MKKKLILGAIALMSVFGGMTIYESMSGQNEAKAGGTYVIKGHVKADHSCGWFGGSCDKVTIRIR